LHYFQDVSTKLAENSDIQEVVAVGYRCNCCVETEGSLLWRNLLTVFICETCI